MISAHELAQRRGQCRELFARASIVLQPREIETIEIADFGLGDFASTGLGIVVYVNTERVCAKELAMLPRQTCPEHRHPNVGSRLGKEETFRCRFGEVYVYVPGARTPSPGAKPPAGATGALSIPSSAAYSVFHEVHLRPGDQYTLKPDTLHWFQAGPEGAVVSEFSTTSTDEADIFTDPAIRRATKVVDA